MNQFSLDNITDAEGYSIALSGLAIVFFALVVVTIFISILPHVLASLSGVFPEEVVVREKAQTTAMNDDEGVIAAIGYTVHVRRQGDSDG